MSSTLLNVEGYTYVPIGRTNTSSRVLRLNGNHLNEAHKNKPTNKRILPELYLNYSCLHFVDKNKKEDRRQ